MPAFGHISTCVAVLCLCFVGAGCVTTHETLQGSFISPSQNSPDGAPKADVAADDAPGWFSWPWSRKKALSARTHLAYAHWEESRAHQAAEKKDREEQRAAIAAARNSYEKVLMLDAKSVEAVIGLARLDQVAGHLPEAEQGFLKALRLDPTSGRSHDALGLFYADQKRWPEATQTLQKAMTANPEEMTYQFHYAIALANSGQLDAARPLLTDAVGVAAAHYNLGVILFEQGDRVRAEKEFLAAIMENPKLEQAQRWLTDLRREPLQPKKFAARNPAGPHETSPNQVIRVAASEPQQPSGGGISSQRVTGPSGNMTAHHEIAAPIPTIRSDSQAAAGQ